MVVVAHPYVSTVKKLCSDDFKSMWIDGTHVLKLCTDDFNVGHAPWPPLKSSVILSCVLAFEFLIDCSIRAYFQKPLPSMLISCQSITLVCYVFCFDSA